MFHDPNQLDKIKNSPQNLEKYIRLNTESQTVSASIVYVCHQEVSGIVIYGAYYGYCGGGENDGGYFLIDIENSETRALGYDDVDSMSEEHPVARDLLEYLMSQVWGVMDDKEGQLEPNESGKALLAVDGEDVYISDGFDGDILAGISEEWRLTLRFED